jgi:hypothetical protein
VFDVEMWIVAIDADIPDDEARRYWNVKETLILDEIIASAPAFRLGVTEVVQPGNESRRGPVGRVDDLPSLRGTLPTYNLPSVDDELRQELVAAYGIRDDDPPFDVGDRDALDAFLADHAGARLATRERVL